MTNKSQCRYDGCNNEAETNDGRCRRCYSADYYRANKEKLDAANMARYFKNRTTTRRRPLDPKTTHRTCCECKQLLPVENFHKDRSRPLGIEARCKSCRYVITKRRWKEHPEKVRGYWRKHL